WTDSRPVPEQVARMNGQGFLAVSAEEGALRVSAHFALEIISGKTKDVSFKLPESVVVYEVKGEGVSDWRAVSAEGAQGRKLEVYLDQPRHGTLDIDVAYDILVKKADLEAAEGIAVPALVPENVHRYQGVL